MTASFIIVACLLGCIALSAAVKETYSKTSSGTFADLVVKDFGMAVGGTVDIDYNVFAKDENKNFRSYVALLVLTYDQSNGWYGDIGNSNPDITTMCQQPSTIRERVFGSGRVTLDIDAAIGEDRFSVAVLQCYEGYTDNPVTVEVTASLKNPRPTSSESSHMPIQMVMETRVIEGELIIFALLILGMGGQIYIAQQRYTRPIHWLFLGTLVSVFVFMAVKYGDYYRYNKYGTNLASLEIAQNVFSVISTALLLASLLLLSLGWTLIRSALSEKEWQLIWGSLGAYLVFGLAGAACISSTDMCLALNLVPFIIQSLIMLGIIIAMNFSVTQLRAMVSNSPWVPSTPLQYARLKQYQVYRLVFLLYLLLPTCFLIFEVVVLSWREQWISFALTELLDIAMIFHVGVTFSPLHDTLMTRAFDGSNSAAAAVGAAATAGAAQGGAGGGALDAVVAAEINAAQQDR